jgi:hypothetical protein
MGPDGLARGLLFSRSMRLQPGVLILVLAAACQPAAEDAADDPVSDSKSDSLVNLRALLDRAVDQGSAAPAPGTLSDDFIKSDHAHYHQS